MKENKVLTLILPTKQHNLMKAALRKAGQREVGGILMGEKIGNNVFIVREITIHRHGTFASFIRRIEDAIGGLRAFFKETGYDYVRFNYIGEWHSHPSFEPYPSRKDDLSMLQIVKDETVGANFVALLITKLGPGGEMISTVHTYLPDGSKIPSTFKIET